MRVAVNLTRINGESPSGIAFYVVNLVSSLINIDQENEYIVYCQESFIKLLPKSKKMVVTVVRPSSNKLLNVFWFQIGFPRYLKRDRIDVLFNPSFFSLIYCPAVQITTIHDCSARKYTEFLNVFSRVYFEINYYITKYFADKVVAISEFTKKQLINIYGYDKNKIIVNYPALPALNKSDVNSSKTVAVNVPYLVYVGNSRPRKNLLGLLKAFALVAKKNTIINLVIIGKSDPRFVDIEAEIRRLKLEEKVIVTGYVTDSQKEELVKRSLAMVFPTFYEGFGLPVLEAQSLGVPVLTSKAASLPEVGGDAVIYVDPFNIKDIARGMLEMLDDSKLRTKLIAAGYKNEKRFSWDKSAQELVKVMEDLHEKSFGNK